MEFLIVLFALLGGYIGRMCGGAKPKLPWKIDQIIYCTPIATLCLLNIGIVAGVAVLCASAVAKSTGHGRGREMIRPMKEGAKPEKLEILIRWLEPYISVYWYKFILMSCSGLLVSLPPALCFLFVNPSVSLVLLAGGMSKGAACALGWAFPEGKTRWWIDLNEGDARGEFLAGAFFWISCYMSFMIL